MPTASSLPHRLVGAILKQLWALKNGSVSSWLDGSFTPHMAAARRAILERILLVDLTIEIRDARLPISSAFEPMRHISSSHKRFIVLNKVDLADRSLTEEWIKYFEERNCVCYAINSHNKDNIKEFLNFVRARTRELKKDESDYTATVMLVGIPNAGKSAIANSMHQIGRISAAEKGKLKHAVVSPLPGETKDISSLKIASHPNIYVLDTPGVLSPEIPDVETGFKLALTGAIRTCLVGECELARYFLAIFNSGNEYNRWESLTSTSNHREQILGSSDSDEIRRRHYPSDHTQDFIVNDARRTLFRSISSVKGNLETETEMAGLIEAQFAALHEVFRVPLGSSEDGYRKVAAKLLNLYRTGRLGRYTLDSMQ